MNENYFVRRMSDDEYVVAHRLWEHHRPGHKSIVKEAWLTGMQPIMWGKVKDAMKFATHAAASEALDELDYNGELED